MPTGRQHGIISLGGPSIAFGTELGRQTPSLSLTTTANAPAGALIILGVSNADAPFVDLSGLTASDTAGNTYTLAVFRNGVGGGWNTALMYKTNANALALGGVITIAGTGGSKQDLRGLYFTGANGGVDKTISQDDGNLTNTSFVTPLTTAALSSPNQVAVTSAVSGTNGTGAYVNTDGFTLAGAGATRSPACKIVNSTSPVSWNPTWTVAQDYNVCMATFMAG